MKINYSAKKVFIWLLIVYFVLLLFNIVGIIFKYIYPNNFSTYIYAISSFDSENSISTLYSSVLLLTASGLLFFISSSLKKVIKNNTPWLVLGIIFLYLSIDESISFHERFTTVFRDKFNLTGLLYYSWVVPYFFFLIIFLIVFIPFLIRLEKRTRNLFIISGIIFVSGAMGIEIFEAKYIESNGGDLGYTVYYTFEESFEMLGISLFIYALLRYISLLNPNTKETIN